MIAGLALDHVAHLAHLQGEGGLGKRLVEGPLAREIAQVAAQVRPRVVGRLAGQLRELPRPLGQVVGRNLQQLGPHLRQRLAGLGPVGVAAAGRHPLDDVAGPDGHLVVEVLVGLVVGGHRFLRDLLAGVGGPAQVVGDAGPELLLGLVGVLAELGEALALGAQAGFHLGQALGDLGGADWLGRAGQELPHQHLVDQLYQGLHLPHPPLALGQDHGHRIRRRLDGRLQLRRADRHSVDHGHRLGRCLGQDRAGRPDRQGECHPGSPIHPSFPPPHCASHRLEGFHPIRAACIPTGGGDGEISLGRLFFFPQQASLAIPSNFRWWYE